jgi:hypothetical protein
MEEKKFCSFCNDELGSMSVGENKCEYCNKLFCNRHIHYENHNCPNVPAGTVKSTHISNRTLGIVTIVLGTIIIIFNLTFYGNQFKSIPFTISAIFGILMWFFGAIRLLNSGKNKSD